MKDGISFKEEYLPDILEKDVLKNDFATVKRSCPHCGHQIEHVVPKGLFIDVIICEQCNTML